MNLQMLRRARSLALVALALMISGCSTWQPLREPVAEAVAGPKPENHVLIHTKAGARIELEIQEVTADSLRGWAYGRNPRAKQAEPTREYGQPLSLALADIARIESRQPDAGLTALAVLGIVGVVVAAIGAVALSQMEILGSGSN